MAGLQVFSVCQLGIINKLEKKFPKLKVVFDIFIKMH